MKHKPNWLFRYVYLSTNQYLKIFFSKFTFVQNNFYKFFTKRYETQF